MILFYVRHGDPIYSPDQLTPLGHRQAESVAKRLALFGVDEIYSSTSTRAMQTAQPTCEILGLKPEIADWTSEGHTWEEFTFNDPNLNGAQNWVFHVQTTRYKTPEILAMRSEEHTSELQSR